MNRERAGTCLRVLAEAELRRAASQPWGNAQRAGYAARVNRVAQVLAFVGALDDGVADQILDDFELAVGTRQTGQIASVLGWFGQRAARRARLARGVSVPPGAAGRSAAAGSGTGTAAGRAHAPVPLEQLVRVRGADVRGEVWLLSYARVASGPQFSVLARTRQPSGSWQPSGPRLFDPFTATDDQGASYQVTIRDIGSPVLGWTLMLRPDPPHDPRWLDLATTAGGRPAARIVLAAAAGEAGPPAAASVTVSQSAPSPGEHLLSTIAARLLAAVPPLPHDPWLYGTASRPRALPGITDGLGDVIAALQECGALPPLSPVPGQLATLCARLNVTGHGITTPPARDLPRPWLSVLTQYEHRETGAAPVRDGCAAAAVVLPELDGIQLTILGLHNCAESSILHMHASGPACHTAYGPDGLYSLAADMDMRQPRPLARHPHQRPERNGRRNRATTGNSATAEPRCDLDRGAGNRAISSGPRKTPAPLAITSASATGTPVMRRAAPTASRTTEPSISAGRACVLHGLHHHSA